jgi:hypothetical protein
LETGLGLGILSKPPPLSGDLAHRLAKRSIR